MDANIGLLHRVSELLIEMRLIFVVVGYLARMDYVNHIQFEFLLLVVVARYSGILKSNISVLSYLSVLTNHVLNVTCSLGDLGCISFILWGFEDREILFALVDILTGTRMHNHFDTVLTFIFGQYALFVLYDSIGQK